MFKPLAPSWRLLVLLGAALSAVLLARIVLVVLNGSPIVPPYLYSFDTVNFALALRDFDPARNQPQPPGYPFFVAESRLLLHMFLTAERTFVAIQILICGLSVGMLFILGKQMFSRRAAVIAAALLFTNPIFWFSSLTSPLRPHLALVSILVAYFCWRAVRGETWAFQAASVALGLGSGFRPELLLLLIPLWMYTAWLCQRWASVLRGALLLGLSALLWMMILVIAFGGLGHMISDFKDYFLSQSQQTSVLLDPRSRNWVRWAGRAVLWNFLGTLPWIWTIPFGWSKRQLIPEPQKLTVFLAAWFLPSFIFQLSVHVGDPDHVLATIPALCLIGGSCLFTAEQAVVQQWIPGIGEYNRAVTWAALVGNALLFFGQFPIPQRETTARFRGLESVADAVLVGTYETSYARIRWVNQMMELAVPKIQALKSATNRPVVIIWGRDGEPSWRKISYYLPAEKVYSIGEAGDPAVPVTIAELWLDNKRLEKLSGEVPIRIAIPTGARLIWLVGAASVKDLANVVPLIAAPPVYYTDLPWDAGSFRWRSFEFVPR